MQFTVAFMRKYFVLFLLTTLALTGTALAQGISPFGPPPPPAAEVDIPAQKARLANLEAQLAAGKIPADPQNLALLRFKLEQAQLWIEKIESPRGYYSIDTPRKLADGLDRAATVARATGDAVYPATTQQHERAYISPADNSAQPYWVFVPAGYTPRRKYTMVVFLHGYSPDITKAQPWIPSEQTWKLATSRDVIFVVPYGRRNSDFVGIGEDDTVTVTNEVKKRYSVDENRVFLLGVSMGGYGAHAIGLHQPDIWAGVTPMCGRTDFYLWFNLNRDDLPPWKQVLYDADDPRHLKANALNLPIFMQHGALDNIVPTEHSRRYYNDLKALGYPVRYREIADGDHYIYWEDWAYVSALDWLKFVQRAPTPLKVRYSTAALRNKGSYWVAIDGFNDYSQLAHIEADLRTGNTIHVNTKNVKGFTLTPPAGLVKLNQPLTLVVDGVRQEHKYDANKPVRWPLPDPVTALVDGTWPRHFGPKTPQRCGPIKEAYRDPFLLVYGSDPDDEQKAQYFAREWYLYADGKPPIKAATEVTEADRQNYNLILFGTRATNTILNDIAHWLPVELTPNGYRLGKREYAAKEVGMQLCYASPYSAKRMIVVQSGLYWGGALPLNHKYDLLPEFIVYDNTLDPTDSTNTALAAGFFDHNWQLLPTAAPIDRSQPPAPPQLGLPGPNME